MSADLVPSSPHARRQITHDLDALARYLRRDGMWPLPATRALRDELARGDDGERSDPCLPPFRPPNVERVTTTDAAARLGITSRAVVARLNRGTLCGHQLDDGRWLVDADQLPPSAATACPAPGRGASG